MDEILRLVQASPGGEAQARPEPYAASDATRPPSFETMDRVGRAMTARMTPRHFAASDLCRLVRLGLTPREVSRQADRLRPGGGESRRSLCTVRSTPRCSWS